jgi:superfamily II DNA or RNA helicase
MTLDTIQSIGGYTLLDGQRSFIERMTQLDSGLVAAETGCGKTCIAITMAQLFGVRRLWVIAPKGVSISDDGPSQWVREIQKFNPCAPVFTLYRKSDVTKLLAEHGHLPHGIYVSSFDSAFTLDAVETPPKRGDAYLASRIKRWSTHAGSAASIGLERNGVRCLFSPSLATLYGNQFDMVVLDECHNIGPDTIASRALRHVAVKHRWAFSATPIKDRAEDVLPILDWVDPRGIGAPIHQRLKARCGLLAKRECRPDMPECSIVLERIDMSHNHRENYHWTVRHSKYQRSATTAVSGILSTAHTPWITTGPHRVEEFGPKLKRMSGLILDETSQKWLIVSPRIELSNVVERSLQDWRSVSRIDSTSKRLVVEAAKFRSGKSDTLIMGAKCAVAHSFPECSRMVILGFEWSPFVLEQVAGRIYRLNSKRDCKIYILVHAESIEEIQLDLNLRKDRQIKQLLGGNPIQIDRVDPETIMNRLT